MDIKESFGNKIRELRKKHKMSQETLAEALEIETSTLSSLETGKTFVSYKTFSRLCEVFSVLPRDLFDFNMTTIDSQQEEIIREINYILPELDSEKLYYLNNIARMFANKD